ncbi:hypothetical protein C8J57DRAFT_1261409 [Mycena rebaudengoi]|nr:hypothetical protein C8J57DRAFT_1261409 [Mycena rebaudengoi]
MAGTLDSTYGVAFVTLLYGIGLLQTFLYLHWYSKDWWAIKTTVVCVVILETIEIILYSDGLYLRFIDNFSRSAALGIIFCEFIHPSRQDSAQLLAADSVDHAVSIRIHRANVNHAESAWKPFLIAPLTVNPWAKIVSATIGFGGDIIHYRYLLQPPHSFVQQGLIYFNSTDHPHPVSLTIQPVSCLACDVVITAALVYTLRGSKGEIKGTNAMLSALIINAVNRGMLTALCAMINMILFIARPGTFYFFLRLVPSGKLYMSSMLATLNSREHIRSKAGNWDVMSLSPLASEDAEQNRSRPKHIPPHIGRHMMPKSETETFEFWYQGPITLLGFHLPIVCLDHTHWLGRFDSGSDRSALFSRASTTLEQEKKFARTVLRPGSAGDLRNVE